MHPRSIPLGSAGALPSDSSPDGPTWPQWTRPGCKTALLRLPSSSSSQRVLAYQGRRADDPLLYKLSPKPTDANAWSGALTLWEYRAPSFLTNPTLIGDNTTMHLFWIDYEYSQIFRSSMPIDQFPSTFTYRQFVSVGFQHAFRLGGVQVYTVKGMKWYLMIIEVEGSIGDFYRSFTSADFDGSWTPQATSERYPFAGQANSGARWTNDISGADIIRSDPDQTFTIDACSLQLLYRGNDLTLLNAGMEGYRPGLLTLNATFTSSSSASSSSTVIPVVFVTPTTITRTKTIITTIMRTTKTTTTKAATTARTNTKAQTVT
jgi:hypothetical protein